MSGTFGEPPDSLTEVLPFSPLVHMGGADAVSGLVVTGCSATAFNTGLTGRDTGGFTDCTPQLAEGKLATIIAVLGVTL